MSAKNVKPFVRPEDLALAVAAARTAWIRTGINQDDCVIHPIAPVLDLRWFPPINPAARPHLCGVTTSNHSLRVN